MDASAFTDYAVNGWHLARGVFSREEVAGMIDHYMAVRASGPRPGDFAGAKRRTDTDQPDPGEQFPRPIQMHEWDEKTRVWMNDPRLLDTVSALFRQPARLIQTMVYYKPPGSRGQSFHQDNLYLRLTPVMGVWVALDPADAENGAMEMIRGSHLLGLLPAQRADTDLSITDNETVIPPYLERVMMTMDPGDAVFFGGLTIHGSMPNRTSDRFRRSFICHYAGETTWPIAAPDLPPHEE